MSEIYRGEIQLAGWSETHSGGAKVTFWLPDSAALDAFRGLTARKGNMAGQILAAMIVTVDHDDMPELAENENNEPNEPVNELKGGPLAKLAGQWERDTEFLRWMSVHYADIDTPRELILMLCGIKSRRMLDHNREAAALFNQYIREPYMGWQEAHK